MKKILIKYHLGSLPLEQYGDWIDLRSSRDIFLEQGEYANIPLGVSMKLPKGYEAHIVPRSSTFKNYGILLVNGMGIIDNAYSGDNDVWGFPAYATRRTAILCGARIAQFRIVKKQPKIRFRNVFKLDGPDRGGFGSTGTK